MRSNGFNKRHNPRSQSVATGVLIHGCHLKATGWNNIVWGDGAEHMGRLPQGMLTAYELNAECIVLGSGASCEVFTDERSKRCGQALLEAEYAIETLRCRFDELPEFRAWQSEKERLSPDQWLRLKNRLLRATVSDITSQNTVAELKHAGQIFADRGIQRVALVSSPTHLPRVVRDATLIFQNDAAFSGFSDRILAVPSRTCFVGTNASDVMVLEPPHRPDRNPQKTHSFRQLVNFDKEDETGLVELLSEISNLATERLPPSTA